MAANGQQASLSPAEPHPRESEGEAPASLRPGRGAAAGRAVSRDFKGDRPPLLSSKLEIQVEVLNHGRYTDFTERYCMTHSNTGHQNLTVKSLRDF